MPTDAEITFADHMGRFYARRYAYPPMVGRLLGYLAVCDPPEQSIGELAEALLASRSAISGAVKALESTHAVRRVRVAGERMDRVGIDLSSPRSSTAAAPLMTAPRIGVDRRLPLRGDRGDRGGIAEAGACSDCAVEQASPVLAGSAHR